MKHISEEGLFYVRKKTTAMEGNIAESVPDTCTLWRRNFAADAVDGARCSGRGTTIFNVGDWGDLRLAYWRHDGREASRRCRQPAECGAVVEQLLFWLVLQPHVLPLFSMSAVSASLCVTMMICYSLSAPLHAFATTGIVGVLRGGGDVRAAMLIDLLPLWLFTLPLLVLLGLILHAPIALFCFVMAMESALKVPFGLHRIHSGKWIHDVTKELEP